MKLGTFPWRVWLLALLLGLGAVAQEGQKSSLQVTTDDDGDVAVVLDTESIRMTVLPAYQGCIAGFIFKPTGNDILARQSVKHIKIGSGLLQDNFWEQDWRFSEFRHKWYDFKILSQGPDELVVSFWTTSEGWLQADKSGVISDLISNIRIERVIRMPAGKPYFLCDVTLSIDQEKDKEANAKLPQFWVHNSSLFTDDLSDEYQRPHILGIAEQTPRGQTVSGDFVYNPQMARGWSSQTSPRSREGIVYLMDPDYVQSLYNCGNTTLEWFGDNMLITRARPLKTRIYILPVIGLDKVSFADPHMILKLEPRVIETRRVPRTSRCAASPLMFMPPTACTNGRQSACAAPNPCRWSAICGWNSRALPPPASAAPMVCRLPPRRPSSLTLMPRWNWWMPPARFAARRCNCSTSTWVATRPAKTPTCRMINPWR
jgi:hypothetical protein